VLDRQTNYGQFSGQEEDAGKNGNSRALYDAFHKDFQPRVGLAWQPDVLHKHLVFRGSYTISSYLEGTGTNLRLPLNPPLQTEFAALYNTPQYSLPGTTLDQGLSGLNPKDPFKGATIRLWDPHVRPAQSQQWSGSTEYEFPGHNVVTANYVGQRGTHLMVAMPYFQNLLVNGKVVPGPYLSGNPSLKSSIAQISGTASVGNQSYNALQLSSRKRFGMGFEYHISFTYQHGISDSIGYYGQGGQAGSQSAYWQNLYNQASERGPTYFDDKFVFVPSIVYETPFGRGRKFGSNWNRGVDSILGGWQLGVVYTAHTGFPLTIKMSGDPSGTGARSFRANVVGTPHDPHQYGPGALYLDPGPYAQPTAFTFGNAGVGVVRGPGLNQLNVSLSKQFHITESKYFSLRGDAYSLTNTPAYLSPASQTITSPLFGQIRSAQGERNLQVAAKFYF